MQRTYELVTLLHPDLEIDVEAPISKVEKLIDAAGGKVTKRDNWGKKRLAYRIKRQDFALYVYFEFTAEGETVRRLEDSLLITEEVLRHLVVLHEVPPAVPAKKTDKVKATAAPAGAQADATEDKE